MAAASGSARWALRSCLQFDPVTHQLKQRMALGPEVRHLAITADSKRLLASRFITPACLAKAPSRPVPAVPASGVAKSC